MKILIGTLMILSLIIKNAAFKANEFKVCDSASFCKRNRGIKFENNNISMQPSSIHFQNNILKSNLIQKSTNTIFTLEIFLLKTGPRILIDEPECPIPRYRVKDVLTDKAIELDDEKWEFKEMEDLMVINSDEIVISITKSPFKFKINDSETSLLEFNYNSQFNIECYQNKNEDDSEEKFKNFKDSNPKGHQAISLDLTFTSFEHVYGIPEHAADFSLKATRKDETDFISEPYRLYNLDVFEYDLDSTFGLYGSIPFMTAHKSKRTMGIFWLNAAEMYIDIEKTNESIKSQWICESGIVDLFIFLGPKPQNVIKQYTSITGAVALPQYFAMGYHQCRWNYKDEEDVKTVDAAFDEYQLPYDVLWLDIEHTEDKKYMTWDKNSFPNPIQMQEDLASRGRNMVVIIDPHIKRDNDYEIHKIAEKKGYYVKTKDKKDYDGWCWPGSSSYLDVVRSDVRDWWSSLFSPKVYQGMTKHLYIWNDMNEPSVFTGPENTMPKDNLHENDIEHRDVHNQYGYYYHMATFQGLIKRGYNEYKDGDRPFVLSRSFFAGSQKFGSVWTGDNTANWDHLRASIPMLLSMNIAGLPFVGADVGGFFKNPEPELLVRWYQLGIFYPFFRAHAHIETDRREPWLFGEDNTNLIRIALRERYALLPYIYTTFYDSFINGSPILRPLWYEFPSLHETFSIEDQFMFGPNLLIAPILNPNTHSRNILFPSTFWYDAWTGEKLNTSLEHSTSLEYNVDKGKIPFFYRGGSIVVRKERPRRSSKAMKNDPVVIIISLDENNCAYGEYYSDDGYSFAYENGQYIIRALEFKNQKLTSTSLLFTNYKENIYIEKIIVLGLDNENWKIKDNDAILESDFGKIRFQPNVPDLALVIRKPNLTLDKDFELVFTKENIIQY